MSPSYEIISSGSKGNAVVVDEKILIDCGVPFSALEKYYRGLKVVLLTHIHSDHFKPSTVKRLAEQRPALRFACGGHLANELIKCGVSKRRIDVLKPRETASYGDFKISLFMLHHDVPNCGWKIYYKGSKIIYATDTSSLYGVSAKDFDLYLIEANYTEADIARKIKEKQMSGEYAYELRARENHLSKEKCDEWLAENLSPWGEFVYMHGHEEKENEDEEI